MAKKGTGVKGALQGAIKGVENRFLEVPKGKKVVFKFWHGHNSIFAKPTKFYDRKIVGYLASDFSLSFGSKFEAPFEKASSAILNTIVTSASGGKLSLINKYTSFPVFNGGKPLEFKLDVEFRQKYDAYSDVYEPINYLGLSSLPTENSLGLLSSSYPTFGHIVPNVNAIISSLTSGLDKGSLTGSLVEKGQEVLAKIGGNLSNAFTYVEITVGDFLVFAPIIIKDADPSFSRELSTSRLETITKLTNLIQQYIRVPEARSVFTSKLAEYSLNVPILNAKSGDFSPTMRYPSKGKISISAQTLWAYTQDDAKKSMGRRTVADNEKQLRKVQSKADQIEEGLDQQIHLAKVSGSSMDNAVKELVRGTLGDLVAGGSL